MVSVGTWLVIDAVLDNVIATEIQSGEAGETVVRAQSLRERGARLAVDHPLRGQGPAGWPPRDAGFPLQLSDEEVAFVRTQVDGAVTVTNDLLSMELLHPQVREEQEQSLAGLKGARDELARLTAP